MTIESFVTSPWFWIVMIIISIWSIVWKGLGLWKAAGKKDKSWFIAMLVLNTAGILPIIYLYLTGRKIKKKVKKRKK
ncbi:MAG: hypothetical protein KJ906_01445 [Nanoarchaeota archaeon]|nr:hypothetical protein [Nanoarchaeota archaeon]